MYGRGISYISQRFESHGRAMSMSEPAPGRGRPSRAGIRPAGARGVSLQAPAALATAVGTPLKSVRSWQERVYRWYRRKRRALYLSVLVVELVYIFVTVPLRVAFFFDPYAASRGNSGWTRALTIYTTFDLLADAASVASLFEIFNAKRRALAAIAVDVGSAHVNPRNRRMNRGRNDAQPHGPQDQGGVKSKNSLVVAWSLNTIVPTVKQKFDIRRPLLFELISMIPLELLAIVLGAHWLHVLRFLKVLRLHRVGDCLRELKRLHARRPIVQLLEFTANALLTKRVVMGMALCHWIACAYMAIAHWECGLDFSLCTRGRDLSNHVVKDPRRFTCWAIEDQLISATPLRKYARALYWSSRSLITLGYYDVAPVTDLETLFGIVVQILGAVFSTSLIATFLFVFRYMNARKQAFMTHLDEAKEYMKMSRIPDDVREGVISFYRNVWQAHNGLSHDEVTSRLPEHLRVSVQKALIAQRIHAVSFLAKETEEFVNTLALKVELCVYSPKDWIIENVPDGMFFVLRGNVLIEMASQSQPRHVKAGEHFAEFALLYPGKTDERARAQTFCELNKLGYAWFQQTMVVFHGDEGAQAQLEMMKSMLNRRDQQQQKMKRLFGRSVGDLQRNQTMIGSLLNGGRYRLTGWFLPRSAFRRWWEHLRFVSLTFVAYEVPYFIVFDTADFPFTKTPMVNMQSIASVLFEVFFTVDFVFRCRYFAFIDPMASIPVTDSSYIFQHYRENGMLLDLISILPLATILEFSYGAHWFLVVPLSRLLRMLRIRHLLDSIQEIAHARRLSSKVQSAITLFFAVTLSIHMTGCLWFLTARLSMHEEGFDSAGAASITRSDCLRYATLHGNCSWALFDAYGQIGDGFPAFPAGATPAASSGHRLLSESSSTTAPHTPEESPTSSYTGKFAYMRSIYWSIVALTTVGYGDIVAFSTVESIFAVFWVFFGGIINYAVVASMSNIISNLQASSQHHMEKMNEMNAVLAHYKISDNVRHQIRRYYHQQFYIQKVASEAKLLAQLPEHLRQRISSVLHAESVKKLLLFVDHGDERLLHDLTGLFRRAVYQRGDQLTQDNVICDEILVIVSGRGNIFSQHLPDRVPVGAFCPGSCFGTAEMILRVKSPTFAIATTVVEVSVITYQAFSENIERSYPNEVATLSAMALEQFEEEARALDAIHNNIRYFDKLRKYTSRCTTMFTESRDLSHADEERKANVRFYWEILIIALNIYNAFQITFRIPFMKHPTASERAFFVAADFAGDVILWLDVVLKLYYFECDEGLGNLITREEKNSNYAQHYLRQDLWSLLPLYYIGDSFFWMSVLRVPRLARTSQIPSSFDSLIVQIQQRVSVADISAYLSPFKLLLVLLFAAHFGACVFYWISTMDQNANSWIHHDHVVHEAHQSISVLYLRAYYWALTTLSLVGSREIVPLDVPGTLFASLMCLCCTFVVGHIVGELSDMILELDMAKKELQERESSFEQFAKDHNLPATIRTRVNHYLKFQHHHWKGMDIYETFHDLSKNLKVQLMMDLHGEVLRGLCIAPFLSEGQLRRLALRLESELYIPGDNVVVEGDPGHKLYIIKHGSAMVMWKSTGTAVASLSEGSMFGEVAFFLKGTKRIASVQATGSIELLVLHRRAWDKIMDACDEDERTRTERVLVDWVKDCLKGYNVMTVEIVKDIKSVSTLATEPPHISSDSAHPGALEERAFRLLLRQSSNREVQVAKSWASGGSARHVAPQPTGGFWTNRSFRRIYAADEEENGGKTKPTPAAPVRLAKRPSLRNIHRPFPLLKSRSMKNGTMQQLYPVSNDLKDLYNEQQLRDMEDECWRRYKVSILMSGTIAVQEPPATHGPPKFSRTDSVLGSTLTTKATTVQKSRRPSLLRNAHKMSVIGLPTTHNGTRNSLNSGRHDGAVTTEGMRFLANYGTVKESVAGGWEHQPRATSSIHQHISPVMRSPADANGAHTSRQLAVRRRRFLKRTQSLPIFDRHFAAMVQEELKASNVKDYASKLHLGFEMLRRVRQPEFSYLFKAYKWWQTMKTRWNASNVAKVVNASRVKHRPTLMRTYTHRFSTLAFPGHRGSKGDSSNSGSLDPFSRPDEAEVFFRLLSRWYRIWECFVVLIAVFYALSLPYLICFESRTKTYSLSGGIHKWTVFVCLIDVFCLIDLLLKYTTFQGVMKMNNETHHHSDSHTGKLKPRSKFRIDGYFLLDFVAAMPFDWLLFLPSLHALSQARWFYLALFQFNKIFRIYQAKEASERLAQFLSYDVNLPIQDRTLRFLRSLGAYLLAGHWIACFWYRISLQAYETSPTSWLSTSKMLALDTFTSLDDVPAFRRYLRSAHFAAGSITTVFYGDIASSNIMETVAELGVILLSIFVFGMLVGAHGEHLESKYKHRMQFEQNLTELYYYLKSNDVPQSVRHRIKTYYTNTWLRFHGHDDFEGVQGLSTLLIEDIAQYTLRSFASKVSILQNCDECFLRALLTCLKNVICSPNEPVVTKGDVDRSMYFIARGKIIVEGKGFQLVKEEGDFFGELSLLYGIPRSATCSSLGTSLLYVLEWQAYEALLKDYPEYRQVNRREWVVVSTVLQTGESRFRSIIDIVSRMESTSWVHIDAIIKKAKSLR